MYQLKTQKSTSDPAPPRQITTIRGLVEMGYPEEYVRNLVQRRDQTFAWREDPRKPNSPYLIDLERLEKWKDRQIKAAR